jgi:flavin reductase (DIM6/NTAB) family NADH-FMN oxidoreductase RutF
MKKEYAEHPSSMANFNMEMFGFSWIDFVTAIPSPLLVATNYKANGKPNACLQSWACFNGKFAILSSVNTNGHLYQAIHESGVTVLNFPSADIYDKCATTIKHNEYDDDEITQSGLTVEPATLVNAPRIKECFMCLECRFLWEKPITSGDNHVLMCFEIVNVAVDEKHLDENGTGRYGETGFIFNIHHPINPEAFTGKAHDYIAIVQKHIDTGEY